jgi:hypothetical protein
MNKPSGKYNVFNKITRSAGTALTISGTIGRSSA